MAQQQPYLAFVPRPSSPLTSPPLSFDEPPHVPVPFSIDLLSKPLPRTPRASRFISEKDDDIEEPGSPFALSFLLFRLPNSASSSRPSTSSSTQSRFSTKTTPPAPVLQLRRTSGVDHDGLAISPNARVRRISAHADLRAASPRSVDSRVAEVPRGARLPTRATARPLPAIPVQTSTPPDEDPSNRAQGSEELHSVDTHKGSFLCFGSIFKVKHSSPTRIRKRRSMNSARRTSRWSRWRTKLLRRREPAIPASLQDMVQKPVTPEEYHAYFLDLYMKRTAETE